MYLKKILRSVIRFFERFSFRKKVTIVTIAFIFPFLLPSVVTFEHFFHEIRMIKKEERSLRFINIVKELMIRVQQHRGLEQGYLAGERDFEKKLAQLEKEIDTWFYRLAILSQNEDKSFLQSIQNIQNVWNRIKKEPFNIDKSFSIHTDLIDKLIYFQKKIAFFFDIYNETNIDNHYLIISNFDTLPNIIEYVGKIRGLVTRMMVAKEKRVEEKKKIQKILILLYAEFNTLSKAITHYVVNRKNSASILHHYAQLNKDIEHFIAYTERIVEGKTVVDMQTFFTYATNIIDEHEQFYNRLLKRFEKDLENRKVIVEWKIALLMMGLFLVSIIVTLIFFGFFYSIATPLQKFQEMIERVSKEDYTVRVKLKSKDELKAVADAFNALIANLQRNINFLNGYKIALDSATLVTKSDICGNITYANEAFLKKSGYARDEILGKPHSLLRHPDVPKNLFEKMWKTILSKKIWQGILKIQDKYRRTLIMQTTIVPLVDEKGTIGEFIAIRVDITKLIEAQEKIKRMLYFDTLTGLPNRVKVIKDCQKLQVYGIVLLNIEDFRTLNDVYGYEGGNFVLKEIAKVLKKYEQKNIKIYKFPSDEFAIVFFESKDTVTLNKIAFEVVHDIESHTFFYNKHDVQVLLRAGTAILNEASEKIEEVILDAETAIKEAKRSINKIIYFSESESARKIYIERLKWIEKLKKAIDEDRIEPFFQPIYNNETKKVEKYEALMRMVDEDGRVISPYFFLDIAKKAKLYTKLTSIVIEKSLKYFQNRTEEVSINISTQDLEDEKTFAFILEKVKDISMLKEAKNDFLDGNGVVIEFTESEEVENYEFVATFNKKVKELGCKIAIDDFGTGYSNFIYILNMGIDYLKIDGSLIENILTDERSLTLVKAIVDFSHDLGLKTIAEFVSDEEIQKKVEEIGVDYSQGYFISEPIPIEKVEQFKVIR